MVNEKYSFKLSNYARDLVYCLMQNSYDLVIKNGSVVIPKVGIINTNIMIENGKIKDLSKSLNNISYSK